MSFSYLLHGSCSVAGNGCKGTVDIDTMTKLPGGTITAGTKGAPIRQPFVVAIKSGTGRFAGAKGTDRDRARRRGEERLHDHAAVTAAARLVDGERRRDARLHLDRARLDRRGQGVLFAVASIGIGVLSLPSTAVRRSPTVSSLAAAIASAWARASATAAFNAFW